MNSLSLLIYAVELITNLSTAAWYIFPIFTTVTLILFIIRLVVESDREKIENEKELVSFDAFANRLRYYRRWTQWVAIVAVIMLVVVPNRQTTIMIAASEVAEVVVKTEEAKAVMYGAKGAIKEVGGLSSDAVGLLKTYIQTETKKLADELNPPKPVEPKKEEPAK
ncbi:hypothetical protein PHIM7_202 [Sinorhizobium phage phiM7]|uniref:Uncharacterized protein n=3 Tax=Emdodecavirus TaxID=1980937 RepID=S5MD73_9CAUD|nr:hypothetical protein AB690_gp306 [Sinorhizobium phage phiM12]YP_009212454.1 hypothetical protein AVT40_gp319 [Sinorhizobium phage phiN3]YP_009601327.1 hypothetical protein FDH46_gp276 [Sinorhizobium phage phiM7]AKF13107.1 hypothetical protein PHIM19_202 [Sinorhizobium phage phiM19]AGR47899.1 hypothetical protein SmphiM12_267 [Sinorhizobium phage phiM12]AKF12747.1 hypothetical protein PHIM7_202 [Sinorhizobium phage phiM7]AKF13477.1 hypothetical protein PHIN3_214 [Sinorhizobium phage phiN3]